MLEKFEALFEYSKGHCLILSLLLLFTLSSCNNLFENPVKNSSETGPQNSQTKYVSVTGSLGIDGAIPAEFIQMYQRHAELVFSHAEPLPCHAELVSASLNETPKQVRGLSSTSRTAFPSIPSTGLTYTVTAVNTASGSTEAYAATVTTSESGTNYVVAIPAPVPTSETPNPTKTFKITASVKQGDNQLFYGESEAFTISFSSPVAGEAVNVSVHAKQTGNYLPAGTGNASLEVGISGSGVTKGKLSIDNGAASNFVADSNKIVFTSSGLNSGVHTAKFDFINDANLVLYSFTEVINIFDNLTTNTWVQNGNEPWFVTTTDAGGNKSTTCRITAAMVEGYALKDIYVDSTRNTTNPSDSTYTTQSGTFFNPVTSFDAALAMLHDAGKDYTIYIMGEINGTCTIPDTLKNTGSGGTYTYAHSLTICGYTGLDENGIPQDSLNGNGFGPVLSILTDVPVTITNLKIYGGSTTNGGGICISSSNASVTLTDGALITDNQAVCGGGVYLDTGSLFVYGSAVIGKSGVSSHATSGSYGNKATTSGGGIGVGSGTLWLGYSGENIPAETSGGVICNLVMGATETHGGGIDNQNGTVNIARGNVSYNFACCNTGSTDTGCGGGISTARTVNLTGTAVIKENYSSYGGGVYITIDSNNGHLIMTGGTITQNHANKEHPGTGESWGDGGGVAIGSNASFTISGGTISSNYAERCGGAVVDHFGTAFNIKGSAYIPYDSVHSCNDVYIESNKSITLSETLTPPDGTDGIIASITPSAYTEDTTVFTISSPATSAELSHFKVIPYNGVQEWIITTEGKLREGVVLPSSYSAMVSGNTYLVSDSSAISKIAEFSSSGYNFDDVKLKLESNVTISTTWTPIGDATPFSGTFDGNGKTVTFAAGSNAEAFLGTVNGNVKNLKVAGSASVAGIAKLANSSAVIENCESSATVTSSTTQDYCAGIVAVVENATIKGCVNTGTITSNVVLPADNYSYGAGGITGRVYNGGIVDSCKNTGNVTGPYAGGITGEVDSNSTIRNASNSGNVTSTELHAGGIASVAVGSGAGVTNAAHIKNCFNSGSVTAEGTEYRLYVGGIAGRLGWGNGSWAQNCLNIGNVSISASAVSGSKAGALFGLKDSYSQIDFCYYKEGCADSSFGIGGSTSDTENECIKATQSGTNNAVISAGVTLNETTYSADSSTVLSLLNAWVSANSTGGLYLEWETDTNHWPKLKTE